MTRKFSLFALILGFIGSSIGTFVLIVIATSLYSEILHQRYLKLENKVEILNKSLNEIVQKKQAEYLNVDKTSWKKFESDGFSFSYPPSLNLTNDSGRVTFATSKNADVQRPPLSFEVSKGLTVVFADWWNLEKPEIKAVFQSIEYTSKEAETQELLSANAQGILFQSPGDAYSSSREKTLYFFDPVKNNVTPIFKFLEIRFRDDTTLFPILFFEDSNLELGSYNVSTGKIKQIPVPLAWGMIALPTNKILYYLSNGDEDGFRLYDLQNGKVQAVPKGTDEMSMGLSGLMAVSYDQKNDAVDYTTGFGELGGFVGTRYRLYLKTGKIKKIAEAGFSDCEEQLKSGIIEEPCLEDKIKSDRKNEILLFGDNKHTSSSLKCHNTIAENVFANEGEDLILITNGQKRTFEDASYLSCI